MNPREYVGVSVNVTVRVAGATSDRHINTNPG